MSETFGDINDKMQGSIDRLKSDLVKVRTGRATPSLVDSIKVDYFGSPTPLKQLAQVSVPDAKTLQIASWDQSAIPLIEKSIIASNLGFTPNVDGKIIRINIPPLSEERRKDIAKSVKKMGEDSKVAVRHHRKEANDFIKSNKELSEDEGKKQQADVQKITDKFIAEIDTVVEAKVKDVLTV